MGTVLQWRKFSFFESRKNIDNGKLAEALKDSRILCISAGRGIIHVGDSEGMVHSLNRQLEVTSFAAHNNQVEFLCAFDNTSLMVTASNPMGSLPEIKVWAPEHRMQGHPHCLRIFHPDPRPLHLTLGGSESSVVGVFPSLTAIAVHPGLTLVAAGFSDGSVMLYRGEVRRERGSRSRAVLTVASGEITNLEFDLHSAQATFLFVSTANRLYCINCTRHDKETTVELDSVGCKRGCTAMSDIKHHHELLMARHDAIYTYTSDSRGSCYVFEGEKENVSWYRGYLIVAARENAYGGRSDSLMVTVYDPVNKLIALSLQVNGYVGAVGEWGSLYLITSEPSVIHLQEKDLQSKLELLFKKNQFDVAISLAKIQCCDHEEVAEILKQYGDWLYGKGNPTAAMDQYIKTIPYLEPSYIIKKYLDTQHIHTLTTYLQALHKARTAEADHTSLLLNCYTRLKDTQQLDEFITSKSGTMDCNVELGVRVCRGAGYYDHALALAAKNGLHHHYLAILIHDKKDCMEALRYIGQLEFEASKENLLRYGSVLLNHVPEETTALLVRLCTGYNPSSKNSDDGFSDVAESQYANPEDFEYLLVGHSEQSIFFLEKMLSLTNRQISARLYTMLLSEYLHQYSLAPEGQDQSTLAEKILEMLQNTEVGFDRDHFLLLCDKYQFHAGKLILWEQAGMFEALMAWHAAHEDFETVIDICSRHANEHPQLWSLALKILTENKGGVPLNGQLLNQVLNSIEERNIMPPLEVVDQLASSPYITLGQVREYLLNVVASHSTSLSNESALIRQYTNDTEQMRDSIKSITTKATEFTGTKCNICNNELELPSVHFLCHHSFHEDCFVSYSESEAECPVCLPETKKMKQAVTAQEKYLGHHDRLQEELDCCSDSFSVIAEYLGRGVFTHYQTIVAAQPSLNTTKVTLLEKQLRPLEKPHVQPYGVSSEARLRLGEHRGQGVIEIEREARKRVQDRSSGPDSIYLTTEGQLRSNVPSYLPEAASESLPKKSQTDSVMASNAKRLQLNSSGIKAHSSFEDHIIPTPPRIPTPTDFLSQSHGISSAVSSSKVTQPKSQDTENPFESSAVSNNFADDFETENLPPNPFDNDYDESKNPFAESESDGNVCGTDESHVSSGIKTDNPFEDDYDPSLNPFGE